MSFGEDDPTLNSTSTIIFHNIPYANQGCAGQPGHFSYPIGAIDKMRDAGRVLAGASSASFHG
jgi:hypothetical protein